MSHRSIARAGVLALTCVALARPAHAGLADAPPLLGGTTKAKHVFSIPGVTANADLGTVVMCTSLEKSKPIAIAVEVFAEDGTVTANDVTLGEGVVANVAPSQTVTFEIAIDDMLPEIIATTKDAAILAPGDVTHGSARVLSTSTKLMCTAGVLDRASVAPTGMLSLQVIAKTKQKGN